MTSIPLRASINLVSFGDVSGDTMYSILSVDCDPSFLVIALTGNWILESNTPEFMALRTCFPMNPLRPMIAIEALDILSSSSSSSNCLLL